MVITDTDTVPNSTKGTAILSSFSDSFQIEAGRAVVSLPKIKLVTPADNHTKVQRRFLSLTKRFATTTDFRIMYETKMLDCILQHQFKVTPPGPSALSIFYLPHHSVKKEKRKNAKWRIVFDVSPMIRDSHD